MDPITGLNLGRILVGVVSLFAPDFAARLFMLDAKSNPQLPFLSRLFGAREIALGAVTLAAQGPARRNLVIAGVAVDAADAASGVIGVRKQEVGKLAGGWLSLIAVGAVASGVAAIVTSRE